jgi:hypothetical protein
MRDIYCRSAQTVIWLGKGSFYSRQGVKAAAYLAQRLRSRGDTFRPATSRFRWICGKINNIKVCIYCTSFVFLPRRSYFSRVWIVQEVTLGRNPVFVCGDDTILFSDFALAAGLFRSGTLGDSNAWNLSNILTMRSFTLRPGLRPYSDPSWFSAEALRGQIRIDRDLLFLMSLFRGCHATYPQDKVFGLLGLCKEIEGIEAYGITPDYSLTVEQVYINVAITILKHQRNLNLFNAVRYVQFQTNQSGPDLPSWVPDWSDTGTIATPLSKRQNNDNSATGNTLHKFIPVNET